MLVFATSDKGGTGRTVTGCNLLYQHAQQGRDVAYLDFDFGSPTSAAVFAITDAAHGTTEDGLHSYLTGRCAEPSRLDVWTESDRASLRPRPTGAGQLVLFPGDRGGGEFAATQEIVKRCGEMLLRLEEEFDVTLVDLSAGRSYATDIVLAATAGREFRDVRCRWLVFHRWTRQHIIAAHGLVMGERGLVDAGTQWGHHPDFLRQSIRYVRTAVVDPNADELSGLRATQVAWLHECNQELYRLASALGIGRVNTLGSVPLDPVLQWREQIITDADVALRQIANAATVEAFQSIAVLLSDDDAWLNP